MGWHLSLASDFMLQSSIPQRALTLLRWRLLDQFTGWYALLILFAAENIDAVPPPSGALRRIISAALILGIACTCYALAIAMGAVTFHPAGLEKNLELITAGLLALAAAMLVFRQLFSLAQTIGERAGFTIDQLWRLLTIQWILVWVAAEVFLRIKFRNAGGVSADERARGLLFALPAFGVLPNLMASGQIRWHGYRLAVLQKPQSFRVRAWIVAMISLNLGAVCIIGSEFAGRWFSVIGAIAVGFGVVMYHLGFPPESRRGAGRILMASFGMLVVGVLLAAAERIRAGQQVAVLREFGAAWRFLLSPGATILWVAGIGFGAIEAFTPATLQPSGAKRVAFGMLLAGALAIALCFILAAVIERQWLAWVGVGCVLMWLGLLIGCAVALRSWRIGSASQN